MDFRVFKARSWRRGICILLALTTAIGPSLSAVAQTNDVKPVASPKVVGPAEGMHKLRKRPLEPLKRRT